MSSLTITIIQSVLHWEDKQANLAMFEKKIMGIKEYTEVVLLPEMFSTGFSMRPELLAEGMDGETIAWMKKISSEKKVIVAGSLIVSEAGKNFNRLVWMLPNGEFGLYDKRHLFGFASEDKSYAPGQNRLIASVNGWRINLQICYDLRFPVWARQNSDLPIYDLLVYVANWPERRNHPWKTLLQARAIENQCYVVGVNRVGRDGNGIEHSGESMIVDPLGEILYQKTGEEDIFTFTLQKEKLDDVRTRFPFLRDADDFIIET